MSPSEHQTKHTDQHHDKEYHKDRSVFQEEIDEFCMDLVDLEELLIDLRGPLITMLQI
jgi:hypothetical protein